MVPTRSTARPARAGSRPHRHRPVRGTEYGSVLGSVTAEGVVRHFHLDHLGSPRMVTDSTGHTLARHLYFPFGEEATDPSQDSPKLKFTGHERDNLHSGTTYDLDYMHARYYSPQLGRFLSFDPVGGSPNWPQTWNRYSYTIGNPLKYTDPEGLDFFGLFEDILRYIPYWESITVTAPAPPPLQPFNPLTGLQGLGSLTSGRTFLNSLQGTEDSLAALGGWLVGALPRNGVATPAMAAQLADTPAMDNIRAEYRKAGCKNKSYSSDYQYRELLTTTNVTGQLVGGFVANITSLGGGMVLIDAQNTWGLESATRLPGVGNRSHASVQQMLSGSGPFQYPKSLLENRAFGPMGNATLHYIWTESLPCN